MDDDDQMVAAGVVGTDIILPFGYFYFYTR